MYLIVGLGNPGGKYTFTRHNIGFLFADYLSRKEKISLSKNKFNTLFGKGRLGGEEIILAKPQTFMNLSGEGVRDLAPFSNPDRKYPRGLRRRLLARGVPAHPFLGQRGGA
jgi:PTH1 family peptidyl-tRNA hydrolase